MRESGVDTDDRPQLHRSGVYRVWNGHIPGEAGFRTQLAVRLNSDLVNISGQPKA